VCERRGDTRVVQNSGNGDGEGNVMRTSGEGEAMHAGETASTGTGGCERCCGCGGGAVTHGRTAAAAAGRAVDSGGGSAGVRRAAERKVHRRRGRKRRRRGRRWRRERERAGAGAGMRRRTDGEWRRLAAGARAKARGRAGKRECVKRRGRSGEKYDMWTPQKFLSPVDPTLRF
jgi:hypothetical protein